MDSTSPHSWHRTTFEQLHDLAERYGTPYFLYDADEIAARIEAIRVALARQVEVFYAVKANPNLELLRAVRGVADGLDISSAGELTQACLAGYEMQNVSFAGPAKTKDELTAAITHGVGCISVESLRELTQCLRIAEQTGKKASIVLRVNPLLLNRSFGMKMGGRPVQFGVDEEDLGPILDLVRHNLSSLDFHGIHVYAGSQCFETSGIVAGVQSTLAIARQIESDTDLICRVINFGGGFGLSHTEEEHQLDLEKLSDELVPVLKGFRASSTVPRRLIFELGRFLTADAGIYVARVISAKQSRGKAFFMVDGGLHHHLAAAGTFGAAFRANFLLLNLSNHHAPKVKCTIAGPSCNPTDLLGVDVELPEPAVGDLIAVLKSGSYGLTASPLLFLGRPTPAELVRKSGDIILARAPKTIVDFN